MRRDSKDSVRYFVGFLASLVGHLFGFALTIFLIESSAASSLAPQEIFTVTLEGGERLGGISQVPLNALPAKVLPAVAEKATQPPDATEQREEKKVVEKEITQPTVVEDPDKILEEKKKAEAKLKKDKELQEKKAEEEKKKVEEQKKTAEEKKKAEEEHKAEEAKTASEEKKKADAARKERDKKLEQAIKRAANRYEGESANAGGEGFGAARVGGKGMGGGTLASLEFITYRNQLEDHIKRGWHWLSSSDHLVAQVVVYILPTGAIKDAQVVQSSGRNDFDESALRAVFKASPVPPAPTGLYDKFREVRITFDSQK